jgi:phosphate transport system permease protein
MKETSIKYRKLKDKLFLFTIYGIVIISIIPLFMIIYYISKMGISAINWSFLTTLPKPPGEIGGGIANAIVGTLILIGTSSIVAIPISIFIGIYLSEYQDTKLSSVGRYCLEVLQGVPSIVIGIIAYLLFVKPFGGFNALSGGLALAMMMIPIIAKTTEETLKLVPLAIKEAAIALGVPYYKVIIKVIVPTGLNGIITGIILGIARVAGETAPLLFTAFGNPFMSYDITKPMSSMPLIIFNYSGSPYDDWHAMAWGASFILLIIVLILNIIAKIVASRWKIQY